MTLGDFGKIVKRHPAFLSIYSEDELDAVPDTLLALKVLDVYPEYWDLISPAAKSHLANVNRSIEPVGFWPAILPQSWYNPERHENLDLLLKEVEVRHRIENIAVASSQGYPVDVYAQVLLMEKETELKIRLINEADPKQKELEYQRQLHDIEADYALKAAHVEQRIKELTDGRTAPRYASSDSEDDREG